MPFHDPVIDEARASLSLFIRDRESPIQFLTLQNHNSVAIHY